MGDRPHGTKDGGNNQVREGPPLFQQQKGKHGHRERRRRICTDGVSERSSKTITDAPEAPEEAKGGTEKCVFAGSCVYPETKSQPHAANTQVRAPGFL